MVETRRINSVDVVHALEEKGVEHSQAKNMVASRWISVAGMIIHGKSAKEIADWLEKENTPKTTET